MSEVKPKLHTSNDSTTSGYVTHQMQEEEPIFNKRKMNLKIPSSYTDISHLTVAKNWLVCIVSPQTTLLRFFLQRANPPAEIPLEKYIGGYAITKLFLDPTGHHLLISVVPKTPGLSADFLYIHGSGPKVRRIEKFKDHEITSVAFNYATGNESTTGQILLGTSRGLIFETELTLDGDKTSFRKPVYDLGLGLDRPKYPITGLEFFRMPNSNKYIVVATTPDCIYVFNETLKPEDKLSLQAIFNSYMNGTHSFEEVKSDLKYSVLRFYIEPNAKYPTQYGWLCGTGIRTGQVESNCLQENILLAKEFIPISTDSKKHIPIDERRQNVPKSFMLTEFHVLLLYPDHITGICLLNQEIVYEEYFPDPFDRPIDIVRDDFTGIIYVYTSTTIFNYKITDEKRDIWEIYLSKGMYDLAEVFAAENPAQLDIVLAEKAEVAFEEKDYIQSAEIYSQTTLTFEHICLKFLSLEEKRPIIVYVRNRLEKLRDEDVTQITMLVVWLVELYLTEISRPGVDEKCRAEWQADFNSFMRMPRVDKCIQTERKIIYDLISSHGDSYNLSMFAAKYGDYESVINQHINQGKFSEALAVLRAQEKPDLFYKYCPILMEEHPQETVDILMAQGKKFEIEKIIPTLICIDSPKHIDEICKYLEYAIFSLDETTPAIHNYLLKLYAEHKPEKLEWYLNNAGNDITLVHYDVKFALRTCIEHDAKPACVFIQCLLERWEDAVELALTFNIQLAKDTAKRPSDDVIRRKLWLKIAKHEIKGTNDVKKALELLKECDLLRIEDLLPFFSDFEKIDDFKDAICFALREYNQNIQDLQKEMEESSKSADRVRQDLQSLRERSVRIGAQEPCSICETFLLVKPFFVFPCGHKFHADCLEKQIIPILSSDQSRKLTSLKHQLENMLTKSIAMAEDSNTQRVNRDKIKLEIETILASDCLFCGLMIESIDQPFVVDWDQENVDWE